MNGTGPALAFRQLPVKPDDGLPQRFSVTIGSRAYDVMVYANLFLGRVDTTAASEVIGGQTVPQTVTPGSMKGITVGTVLAVGGPSDREIVAVSQVTATNFRAIFRNPHGPWPYAIRCAFHEQDPPETLYDLAGPAGLGVPVSPPGYLVLRIDRRGEGQTIFLRKTVVDPNLEHTAQELVVKVPRARIARGNLNGRGSFGSQLAIGVAQRWA